MARIVLNFPPLSLDIPAHYDMANCMFFVTCRIDLLSPSNHTVMASHGNFSPFFHVVVFAYCHQNESH